MEKMRYKFWSSNGKVVAEWEGSAWEVVNYVDRSSLWGKMKCLETGRWMHVRPANAEKHLHGVEYWPMV